MNKDKSTEDILLNLINSTQLHLKIMSNRYFTEKTDYLMGYKDALEGKLSALWYLHAALGFQDIEPDYSGGPSEDYE